MSEEVPPPRPLPAAEPPSIPEIVRRRGLSLTGGSLRTHAARGALINASFMVGLSGLGLLRGFILAGFLTRNDYGVWGILVVTMSTLVLLKQVGIGDKYVQQDEEDQELAFQKAFTLEAAFTSLVILVLLALLPLIALVYGQHQLIAPGLVMLAALPAGVLQMPIWSYYRRMEYVRQRALLSVDPVVGFVVSIALAVAGAGYWALILGLVAGAWAGAIASVAWSPYRLRLRYDRATLRSYAGFSWPLFAAAFGHLVIAQGAILMSNAFLGLAGAGVVTLAATITVFTERVDELVTGTLYPALAAVRGRMEVLYESFVKSNRLALMWAVPFGFGLSLFSSDIVSFGIGEEWRPAVIVLQFFGATAAVAHIGFNWDAYFRAIGDTKPIAVATVSAAVTFLVSGVPLIAAYGLTGLAIATLLQMLATVSCRAYFLGRLFNGFGFLRYSLRAVTPTVPAALAILLVRVVESGERTALMAAGELALYVLITAVATVVFEGPLLREALGYLRGRPAVGAPA
jgi:polysaccharide transporter, PST family